MKLIKPTVLTDAMLVSSTAAEDDHPAWDVAINYIAGDKCIRTETHKIYECLTGNIGNIPEDNLEGVTPYWAEIGPTNRWAMFDNVVGTATTVASPLTIVLTPGSLSGLGLLELVGDELTVTLKEAVGGAIAYTKTISLDGTVITDIYDWFFQPFEQLTDVVLTDLSFSYFNPELTISITATAGNVSCGVCKFGEVINIGGTMRGATAGIESYSSKEKDSFGRYTVVKRDYAKEGSFKIECDPVVFNRNFRALAAVESILCVWVGSEVAGYAPFIIYGFYVDFSIDVRYAALHYCTLTVEGVV